MVDAPNIDNFDDADPPAWDLPSLCTPSAIKDLSPDQIKQICDHKRRIKRIEAMKKIILAAIASIPIVIAMLR